MNNKLIFFKSDDNMCAWNTWCTLREFALMLRIRALWILERQKPAGCNKAEDDSQL